MISFPDLHLSVQIIFLDAWIDGFLYATVHDLPDIICAWGWLDIAEEVEPVVINASSDHFLDLKLLCVCWFLLKSAAQH